MPTSMGLSAGGIEPENSSHPPLSRPGSTEPKDKLLHTDDHHVQLPPWDVLNDSAESHESTSASSSDGEQEIERNGGDCDKMIEKWRLIRFADKKRKQKKVYPTYADYIPIFGKNYSKFYEAFRQGISTPPAHQTVTKTVPAKRRLEIAPNLASKRRRQNNSASLPLLEQPQSTTTPARPSATAERNASTVGKPSDLASHSSVVEESSFRPRPTSDSAAKEQPSRRKGVGLYAGNWEYVTDEEKVPEYLSVAEKIADVEGRTTRRAYAQLTSGKSARALDDPVRKSTRVHNPVDYAKLSKSGEDADEAATAEHSDQIDISSAQAPKEVRPSSSVSSNSNRSTSMPESNSRSTSTSTATVTDLSERPKASWNAIVYEILALADGPLVFPEIMQSIKKRYPFFKAPSQDKILKSGLKNPLYFHEAFTKGAVIDGKQTWGLKPGRWLDKKTGKVLTPQPRNPIGASRQAQKVHQAEGPSSTHSTPKVSPSNRPRTSNPRFGREILNPPEIPDSQDALPTTASPHEANERITTEHVRSFEEPAGSQTLADAVNATSAAALPETDVSVRTPEPHSQLTTTTGPTNTITSILSNTAGVEDQGTRKLIAPIDREASAKAVHLVDASQIVQPSTQFVPSSVEEVGHDSSPTTPPPVIASMPPVHTASPTHVPTLTADGAARSQSTYIIPATPIPSQNLFAYTEPEKFSSDPKADAKDYAYLQRWR